MMEFIRGAHHHESNSADYNIDCRDTMESKSTKTPKGPSNRTNSTLVKED